MKRFKAYFVIAALSMLFSAGGCSSKITPGGTGSPTPAASPSSSPELLPYIPGYQFEQPKPGDTIAIIKTSMGDIKVRLFPKEAPKAVENFVTHAKDGYFDNLIFHRVISNFMIQTGDPSGNGTGGESIWGKPFEDEFSLNVLNYRGALSMANSGANTNGSQFFIVQKKTMSSDDQNYLTQKKYPDEIVKLYQEHGGTEWLDFAHTVFGQVYEGMDIVDKIADVKTDKDDKPLEDVVLKTIEIQEVK